MVNRLGQDNNQGYVIMENQGKTSDPLMSLKDVNKSYRNNGAQIDVLKNLSVDIYSGETIAIVGESGIGKSTFLHILGTLDQPDSGTLLYKKSDVFEFDKKNWRISEIRPWDLSSSFIIFWQNFPHLKMF